MSNVSHSIRTVKEHRFVVPCEEPYGADISEFWVAFRMAENVAKDLGVDTTYDDWIRIHTEDDRMVLVLVEQGKESLE